MAVHRERRVGLVSPQHVLDDDDRDPGGVDAPELRARCERERSRALDARAALIAALAEQMLKTPATVAVTPVATTVEE